MAGISKAERERRAAAKAVANERVSELEEQLSTLKSALEFNAETVRSHNRHLDNQSRVIRRLGREGDGLAAQRDYLIGYANRLLDRFVGVQLLHGLTTIDAAVAFTNAEKAAAEAELQAIKARHVPEPPAGDAIMPELRERFTDAKQGITEDSYALDISATATATAVAMQ